MKVDGQPEATANAEPRCTKSAQLIFVRVAEVADQTEQAVARNCLEEAHASHGCSWDQERRVVEVLTVPAQDLAQDRVQLGLRVGRVRISGESDRKPHLRVWSPEIQRRRRGADGDEVRIE